MNGVNLHNLAVINAQTSADDTTTNQNHRRDVCQGGMGRKIIFHNTPPDGRSYGCHGRHCQRALKGGRVGVVGARGSLSGRPKMSNDMILCQDYAKGRYISTAGPNACSST